MNRILMIGGTRFIGAHAARRLHDAGAAITVLHRGSNTNPILPDVTHVLDPDAGWPVTRFPETLVRDWDVVIHMGAMGEADTRAAAQAFSGRAGRFVLVSSCDVYRAYGRLMRTEPGEPDPVPLVEDAPLRTVFYPYRGQEAQLGAWARDYEKIHAEAAVREAADLDWTILRLPKVYGPEDNGDLATIYGFAGAPDWRWTHAHVSNVAAAIALAARHPDARDGIFNVGEAHTPTIGERLARLPIRADPPEPPPFDFRQSLVLDTSAIRTRLGFAEVVDETQAMHAQAVGEGSSHLAEES